MKSLIPAEQIARHIHLIRGHKVMLDSDLARVYGVDTKALNRAVRRNKARFPSDFMFQLTVEEEAALRFQSGTLKLGRGQHRKYRPHVFTEHGSVMLAAVLHSPVAIEASIRIARAFVKLREVLAGHKDLARRLDAIERRLSDHQGELGRHADDIRAVFEAIRQLMEPKPEDDTKPLLKLRVEGFRRKAT